MSDPAKIDKKALANHTEKKREQITKLATLGEDPDWFKDQLELIAEGKTLEELAVVLQVNYSIYRHWIMGDAKREKAYIAAFVDRKARQLQRVEEKLLHTALNPTGHPKYSDSIRAAEILMSGKNGGNLPASTAPINLNIMFVGATDGRPAQNILPEGTVHDQVP